MLGLLELDELPELRHPDGGREIDVTGLSDVHVWELMEDPTVRALCESLEFEGSAERFRELFPTMHEGMLTNPANPAWFDTATGNGVRDGASDTGYEREQ